MSPITDDELRERTNRYTENGVTACWVTPRDQTRWLGVVPAIAVAVEDDTGISPPNPRQYPHLCS